MIIIYCISQSASALGDTTGNFEVWWICLPSLL